MSLEERLQQAIQRGQRRGEVRRQEAVEREMTEEDLKRLHSQYRLELSEYVEKAIQKLAHHFPGFRFETLFGDRGWGAACSRDDLRIRSRGHRENNFSRIEITIRPYSSLGVVELTGKGTIANKEIFNRTYFEKIEEADPSKFNELIDAWVVEYAERYAAVMD